VRLVIHREDDEIYETLDVELVKKRERGLGLRYELYIYYRLLLDSQPIIM
jgi:hypothetical protein